ncbi:MAG: TatD family hydrolase [Proteobacteria bacterium]|nr:TatD family hydrolase [Pseudomonadota bacterium]
MIVDSHCHLNHKRLLHLGGPEAVVANAHAAGVLVMLTINCRISDEFDEILGIARRIDSVWCTVGTHPHEAGDEAEKKFTAEDIAAKAKSDPKVVGIGETGLDYYYKHSPPEDQHENFRKHIRAAQETGLPLVIHARDADDDIMRIVREECRGMKVDGVMHCFSSSRKLGEEALDFGFYISLSGIVTFKNSTDLQDFVKDVPLDRLLVETDAPYLAPEPHRGKINEPALTVHTAQKVAELKSVSEEQLATITTENFFSLFSKAKG